MAITPPALERPRFYRLAQAARELYPVPVHPASVTRHVVRGVRLQDGSVRKLAATRTPGGWVVTREAVEAFLAVLTADRCGGRATPGTPDSRVDAALDAAGF